MGDNKAGMFISPPSGSFTSWENTMCNPLGDMRTQTQSAWHDGYASAKAECEWQGLTDEEMLVAAFKAGFDVHEDYDNEDDPDALHWWSEDGEQCDYTLHKLRDIIEAKLREKNT